MTTARLQRPHSSVAHGNTILYSGCRFPGRIIKGEKTRWGGGGEGWGGVGEGWGGEGERWGGE